MVGSIGHTRWEAWAWPVKHLTSIIDSKNKRNNNKKKHLKYITTYLKLVITHKGLYLYLSAVVFIFDPFDTSSMARNIKSLGISRRKPFFLNLSVIKNISNSLIKAGNYNFQKTSCTQYKVESIGHVM